MIKAVVFDMFETLVSLFDGRMYFSEHIAADLGVEHMTFRKAWHETEDTRTLGKITIEEGIDDALKALGVYSESNAKMVADGRMAMLEDTFRLVSDESINLLKNLHKKGILTGLISNCYSDEAKIINKYLDNKHDLDNVYINKVLPIKMKTNLEYIKKFNIFYDLKIIIYTILAIIGLKKFNNELEG